MPWTRSLLEFTTSPVEMGSNEAARKFTFDLTNYLQGGTINNITVTAYGGPLDSDYNWTVQTTTLAPTVSLAGNVATVAIANAPTAGWGYRIVLSWQSAVSSGQTIEKFFILRCLY